MLVWLYARLPVGGSLFQETGSRTQETGSRTQEKGKLQPITLPKRFSAENTQAGNRKINQ